jgi:hypothetical protein
VTWRDNPQRRIIALTWSVTAMNAAADRVNRVRAADSAAAFAAIGETVWWVTVVNDTLRAKHADDYQHALKLVTPPVDEAIEGLRSIRHRVGHEVDLVDIIEAVAERPDPGDGRITAWRWKAIPLPTRRDAGDLKGYAAYGRALEGRNIIQTFSQALGFLHLATKHALASEPESS